jgi:hypothetical protein
VRDNPTLKVDIGLGVNGDIVEFHAIPHRFRETSLQGQKNPDLGIFWFPKGDVLARSHPTAREKITFFSLYPKRGKLG